ncbi:hypothetical protein EWM64_g2627 [Hericium alpestre]|uniref:Uncharacterized protein n=1 Tax=Hericium alpestre TaxID=135208 RepID=A0A4Z0A2X7_9AGAM|nr:hypothetical protein EWM64_g2627 [Hericium alpestre]
MVVILDEKTPSASAPPAMQQPPPPYITNPDGGATVAPTTILVWIEASPDIIQRTTAPPAQYHPPHVSPNGRHR